TTPPGDLGVLVFSADASRRGDQDAADLDLAPRAVRAVADVVAPRVGRALAAEDHPLVAAEPVVGVVVVGVAPAEPGAHDASDLASKRERLRSLSGGPVRLGLSHLDVDVDVDAGAGRDGVEIHLHVGPMSTELRVALGQVEVADVE